jgi:ubiquinone biosynthesis monooxygenase Coq7
MSTAKWTVVARILRVNHGGEYGAIRIYRSQIAIARWRCAELLPFLHETLAHEQSHIAQFRGLMPARASRPCRMTWLWGVGGLLLGAVTALLGRQGVLICTEAVERTVHRHLDDQLRHIGYSDPELAQVIRQIQREELGHLAFAVEHRGAKSALDRALDALICVATEALIWLSTRGDSLRLARELRAS